MTSALEDASLLAVFLRALCGADGPALDHGLDKAKYVLSPVDRKDLLAAWTCAQVLIGRQVRNGERVVGALQSYLAYGLQYLDKQPFGRALVALGLSADYRGLVEKQKKRGMELWNAFIRDIPRGSYIIELMDNIRFRVKVKIWGTNKNLELTQHCLFRFDRDQYRALRVAGKDCWLPGLTREEVAQDEALLSRLQTQFSRGVLKDSKSGRHQMIELIRQHLAESSLSPDVQQMESEPLGSRAATKARAELESDIDINLEDAEDEVVDSTRGPAAAESGDSSDERDDQKSDGAEVRTPQACVPMWRLVLEGNNKFSLRRPKSGDRRQGTSDLAPNRAMMMPIGNLDFSLGTTLETLAFKASKWGEILARKPHDSDWQPGEIDCPMAEKHVRTPMLVDGRPAIQAMNWFVEPTIKIADKAMFSAGGWHMWKAVLTHLSRLMSHFIIPIIKQYGRDNPGRIAWFVFPTDPRQCCTESREIWAAILVDGARKYIAAVEAKTVAGPATWEGWNKYMRDRASSCPLARDTFMWVQWMTVIQHFQECAGDRDFETFHGLLPLFGLLFSVTHATGYAQLVWEELVRFMTLSKAEQAIFKEIVFARTAAGGSVFCDYWVEKTNRFLRHYAGHFVVGKSENFVDFINSILLNMEDLQSNASSDGVSAKQIWGKNDSDSDVALEHIVPLGKAFFTTLEVMEKVNVWGSGEIRPLSNRKGGIQLPLDPASHVTINGLPRDPEFDGVLALGEQRLAWYRATALKTNGWEQALGGKPSIAAVSALKKTKHDKDRAQWILHHSTDEDEINENKEATKDFLGKQVAKLVRETSQPSPCNSSSTRSELIRAVCQLRQVHQDKNQPPGEPTFAEDIDIQPPDDARVAAMMQHPLMQI